MVNVNVMLSDRPYHLFNDFCVFYPPQLTMRINCSLLFYCQIVYGVIVQFQKMFKKLDFQDCGYVRHIRFSKIKTLTLRQVLRINHYANRIRLNGCRNMTFLFCNFFPQ